MINDKPLYFHINSKRLFTSVTLLLSSSNLDTIPERAIAFSFFFQEMHKLVIDLVS